MCNGITRPLPGYVLTVAKSGAKLTPSQRACCSNSIHNNNGLLELTLETTMDDLATTLGLNLDRPVVHNQTGITGVYHVELSFVPNRLTAGGTEATAAVPGPTIYDALEHELGLKLEAATFPTDVMVIDSAARAPKG